MGIDVADVNGMRALPGRSAGGGSGPRRRASFSTGDSCTPALPQPGLWAIPVGLAAGAVAGAWLCDTTSGFLARRTGMVEATSFLPWVLTLLALLLGVAVLVIGAIARPSPPRPSAGPVLGLSPDEEEAAEAAARFAVSPWLSGSTLTPAARPGVKPPATDRFRPPGR
jgi:hypothetical protein